MADKAFKNTGKATYDAADKQICELLNDPQISDEEKDAIVARGIEEVRQTWTRGVKAGRCSWAKTGPVELQKVARIDFRSYAMRD